MPQPDRNKLKKIINDHFVYEVIELCNCKALWKMPRAPDYEQLFINMNIEHTILHARGLYEFYYLIDTNPNNYNETSNPRANMYVPPFTKPAYTQDITADFLKRASAQIQHLGIDRTSTPSEKFNVSQTVSIVNDLLRITKDFLDKLEAVDSGFFFDTPLKQLKKDLAQYIQFDPRQPTTTQVSVFTSGTSSIAVTTSVLTSTTFYAPP